MEITKEMAEKIKTVFDSSIKMSALFQFIIITQPDLQKTFPVSLDDILDLSSNYAEIRDFLNKCIKGEK